MRKKMSCVTAVLWVLNLPLCSHSWRAEELECLTLVINPNALFGYLSHTSRVKYRKPNKDPIPNPPTSMLLCLWTPISSVYNSICWKKWRDQVEQKRVKGSNPFRSHWVILPPCSTSQTELEAVRRL